MLKREMNIADYDAELWQAMEQEKVCTGGKHRSVYVAEQLADYFRSRGKNVQSRHRTLEKRKQ